MASEDRWQDVELLRESESGFSAVYRARRHGKWHVLKAIKAEYGDNPIALAQQRKEFDIGYRLSHPGIAAVIGIEDVEGLGMCIVQEWVDGSTLREVMERGDLDRDQAHHITAQLLDALEYIHNRQVVHRDLKPSNIMIAADGNRVKLIDFGVSDTAAHAILKGPAGTRRYAAPELLGGEKIDSRSDLYSLGVIVQNSTTYCHTATAASSAWPKHVARKIATTAPNLPPLPSASSTIALASGCGALPLSPLRQYLL